jgi:cytochrome b pre-mRNA-processing protein 3
MLQRLLRPFTGARSGETPQEGLYRQAVAQARRPEFYTALGAPDEIDARFELYTLHVLLLVLRLRDEGDRGVEAAQALFDAYVSALDNALRELGVGDLSMSKKMRRLAEQLYGRMTAYEPLLRADDADGLAAALRRNLYAGAADAPAEALAAYALAARRTLAAQPFDAVLRAPSWPEPTR